MENAALVLEVSEPVGQGSDRIRAAKRNPDSFRGAAQKVKLAFAMKVRPFWGIRVLAKSGASGSE